jgi:hypothetical protein
MAEPYKAIQLAVDSLLNAQSTVRRKKRTQSDRRKECFFAIINLLEETIVRSNIAYQELQIDLFKFEDKYIQIIDMLMFMNFGEDCMDMISFYLYDRTNDDGTINVIQSLDGQEIEMNNPYDLWNVIVAINPKIDEGS